MARPRKDELLAEAGKDTTTILVTSITVKEIDEVEPLTDTEEKEKNVWRKKSREPFMKQVQHSKNYETKSCTATLILLHSLYLNSICDHKIAQHRIWQFRGGGVKRGGNLEKFANAVRPTGQTTLVNLGYDEINIFVLVIRLFEPSSIDKHQSRSSKINSHLCYK